MPRYRKGTTDHDNDGRMGGSMKEDDMAKKSEPKLEKALKGPTPAEIEAADVEASIGRHPGGMEPPLTIDETKRALEAQFAAADAAGDPRRDETAAVRAMRGF